jgi:hypothetical protein
MKKLISFILFLPAFVWAQNSADSLISFGNEPRLSVFNTKFDKQLSTYTLSNTLNFRRTFGGFDFNLLENYNSTLVKSGEKNVKDEHFFSLKSSYSIIPELSIGTRINNNILSDSRKIEINNASVSDAVIFGNIVPEKGFSIIPFGGYSNNRQIGKSDYGFVYGLESSGSYYSGEDFTINSLLNIKNEDISPRKNLTRYLNVDLRNNFADKINNTFTVNYSSYRKDFYYLADSITSLSFNVTNNIQSRIETSYNFLDSLFYRGLFDILNLNTLVGVYWREIDRDTRYQLPDSKSTTNYDYTINEFKIDFEQSVSFNFGWFEGLFRGIYSERDEKHIAKSSPLANSIFNDERKRIEDSKNNLSVRNCLSFSGTLHISSSDQLLFSFFQNKLTYNTPSDDNYDDRDELYSIIGLRYKKRFSSFFSMFVNAEADFNHVVYIYSERSSNNNLNRVIKLSSGGNYYGKNFSSANTFEVSANYTVYDFEELNPSLKSFSFRQFSWIDSSSVKLSKKLSLILFSSIKLSEQGDFKWNAFSTRPVQYLEEKYFEPKLLTTIGNTNFLFGVRYFSLNTYRFNNKDKYLDASYRSAGPLTEIYFAGKKGVYIRLKGYYEFIKTSGSPDREIPNLNCDIIWNF